MPTTLLRHRETALAGIVVLLIFLIGLRAPVFLTPGSLGDVFSDTALLIILDEPTKGIDVGSKAAVHDFTVELAEQGLAVILVSSELPEVMGMADRVVVMHEGHIRHVFGREEAIAEAIVTAATGATPTGTPLAGAKHQAA